MFALLSKCVVTATQPAIPDRTLCRKDPHRQNFTRTCLVTVVFGSSSFANPRWSPVRRHSTLAYAPPVLVLRPVKPVPDERPDRDPADFERHLLEVDLDGLVLGIRALRTKLDVALVFPEVALQRHLVPEPGYDHLSVLRIGLGFDPDHRAGHKAEPIQGIPLDPDEEIGLATESFCHRSWYPRRHPLLCQNGLARGDTTSNDEGEVVVEEPDVARAPGLELNPGLAFQGEEPGVYPGFVLYFQCLGNFRAARCKSIDSYEPPDKFQGFSL